MPRLIPGQGNIHHRRGRKEEGERGTQRNATQRKQGREASARARKPPTAHRHSPAEPSAAISAATLVKLLSPLGYSKIKKKPGGEFSPFFKTYFLNENIPLFSPTIGHITSFFIIKSNRQH
jgi:hypothetical protein